MGRDQVNGKEKQFLDELLKSLSLRFTYGAGLWRSLSGAKISTDPTSPYRKRKFRKSFR